MKAKHFASAKLLFGATAYCDQWEKIMAIYDDSDNLRIVILNNEDPYGVTVLLIGEDRSEVYNIIDEYIEFGTTTKDMQTCFDVYYALEVPDIPKYRPMSWKKKYIEVSDILTHSRGMVIRHGGFHTIADVGEKILEAMKIATPILESIEPMEIWRNNSDDYCSNHYTGDWACPMQYIGDGVWCDDDGDNWDFC